MKIGIKLSDILFSIAILAIWPLIICLAIRSEFDLSCMTFNQWMVILTCVFGGAAITFAIYQPILNGFLFFCKKIEPLSKEFRNDEIISNELHCEGIDRLLEKIEGFRDLKFDWDSYGANPPGQWAVEKASLLLLVVDLAFIGKVKVMVRPSSMGGIGVAFRNQEVGRRVYVEFLNNETCCVLFSDGKEEPIVRHVYADYNSLVELELHIEMYLDVK